MTEEQAEFADLMRRLQEGSEEAARELVDKYGSHILRVVRRRLRHTLRSRFDSADFVQAVWASFFADRAELGRFQTAEEIVAFLARMAQNKVNEETRHQLHTRKCNLGREQSLDDSAAAVRPSEIAAVQPTPSEVAVAHDLWDHLVQQQPLHYQRILALRCVGCTYREIADQLGLNEKTVRRVLEELSAKQLP
jgi:RNA polymerase sigma-70 factor (ECF subfamily)